MRCFGGTISEVLFLPEQRALIVGNGLWFERVEKGESVSTSRRVSWDGMLNVTVTDSTLVGEAYDPMTNDWIPFEVDLETDDLRGGEIRAGQAKPSSGNHLRFLMRVNETGQAFQEFGIKQTPHRGYRHSAEQ